MIYCHKKKNKIQIFHYFYKERNISIYYFKFLIILIFNLKTFSTIMKKIGKICYNGKV